VAKTKEKKSKKENTYAKRFQYRKELAKGCKGQGAYYEANIFEEGKGGKIKGKKKVPFPLPLFEDEIEI